jgi:TnpA family transposase
LPPAPALPRRLRTSRNVQRISPHWDDILRLTGSLLLGRVPATGIMRTRQIGDNPTRLAQAIAEFDRIDKTLHTLNMIDDENKRGIETDPASSKQTSFV